eukprot:CAMPEP_0194524312 /NCGR_PEP_ID=MMETSP0253-20130528/59440_1 /TAXON_ID=2966 /ORGANISM="Noctiluca scintillans" /LENGTH=293 /DNA_ID=CAMNT_0039368929 /DNA_START=64 /DNA_END=945 /DNA_ORIENTATION=-
MSTPQRSRSASPDTFVGDSVEPSSLRQGTSVSSRGTSPPGACSEEGDTTKDVVEDMDRVLFDWQFEILNKFPRDKAIQLVNVLKTSERQRVEANGRAAEHIARAEHLQRRVCDLETAIDETSKDLSEDFDFPPGTERFEDCGPAETEAPGSTGVPPLWSLRRVLPVALPTAFATMFLMASLQVFTPLSVTSRVPEVASVVDISGRGAAGVPSSEAGDLEHVEFSGDDEGNGRRVRETVVREVTMRETTTREYDPEFVERMLLEHRDMHGELQRLWSDVAAAIESGQEMVCWNV